MPGLRPVPGLRPPLRGKPGTNGTEAAAEGQLGAGEYLNRGARPWAQCSALFSLPVMPSQGRADSRSAPASAIAGTHSAPARHAHGGWPASCLIMLACCHSLLCNELLAGAVPRADPHTGPMACVTPWTNEPRARVLRSNCWPVGGFPVAKGCWPPAGQHGIRQVMALHLS